MVERDDAVVSIVEVGREVEVLAQVARHRLPMVPHLRIACSRLDTFLVVRVP